MAVIGGLAVMFVKDRDKQTTSSIVAGLFLISFFINVGRETKVVLQIACMTAFAMAVLGGVVTILSDQEHRRTGAIVTGIVALGTSLLILFTYLNVRLF
jgi:drug/metabolite transporter (DMT)-like permease